MKRWIVIVCALFAVAGASYAVCPAPRTFYNRPFVKKVAVVKEVVVPVAVFQPLVVAVPTFTAAYSPSPAGPPAPGYAQPAAAPAAGPTELQQILAALKALDARLKRLEGGALPPAPQPRAPEAPKTGAAPAAKGLALALVKCAGCHDAKKSARDGGGFTLFADGKLSAGDKLLRRALASIRSGDMPKGGKLTDEEVQELADFYIDVKATK